MPETLLLAAGFAEDFKRELARTYRLLDQPWHQLSTEERAQVRAFVTFGHSKADLSLMEALPNLGLICCYGSGYDGVDVGAAAARGIVVAYSPGANAASVADFAMGLIIAGVRQILVADRFVREGRWKAGKLAPVRGLSERKLGIYGLGNIGAGIAARAAPFEMEIGYHGRQRREGVAHAYHADLVSLAAWADVLVVSVRADDGNRHSVDAGVLAALGPEGYLVNVARGSVVDQAALIAALKQGTIAGAGLDVFEGEPDVPEELIAMQQVILAPHIGAGSLSAHRARQTLVLANLEAFFTGKTLRDVA
ncbi:2-hydroxyacid dehydrogenase [Starkeya sp. ORNL1]|uniref:2-hydroxyacid dehydrogenase n=1 Tax=Starkeya sp. ORNL1 TaxID=2709380 RepID=UPI001463AAAD|nr:2-hydroxyacid dehydrogenase [Starkeya sp. ORNL1]QJP14578.1 2-hydroxyacid dehydrogenase [Starkeya sp. ORNL1]